MRIIQELLDYLNQEKINYQFIGDIQTSIIGFSGLNHYESGTMTWVKNVKKAMDNQLLNQEITLAVTKQAINNANIKNQIVVEESKRVFFSLMEQLVEPIAETSAIGVHTYIGPKVVLGKNVRIGANCVIDGNIEIDDGTIIGNNVVIIYRVSIGKNCIIQSGAVIGEEGFSYWEEEHQKTMVKHYGGIKIEDDVRIGANTCIVRGTIDNTVIGAGSKIDNLCHIAHNCQIGKNCIIIAGATLCGSVVLEDNAYVSSAYIRQQLHIGTEALIGLGAVVVKDVPAQEVVIGNPAKVLIK